MIYKEQAITEKNETVDITHFSFTDMQSFEVLFRQYYQMLCSYAYRFVNDSDTAEEIVQDLFYKLWAKRSELQINVSVKSYLFSAVHNRCLKFIEHRNVEARYKNYYLLHESEVDAEPHHHTNVGELQMIIDQTLDSLPERCSKIFRLNRFEGLKYHEIANKLSISIKTVEANMGKALKMLRKKLKDYVEIA
jgi:RNA polymerase sigma-70 factor, ECF subfamily